MNSQLRSAEIDAVHLAKDLGERTRHPAGAAAEIQDPDKAIIEGCIREVGIHLRSGSLFKFQVQGHLPLKAGPGDTWC